MFCYENTELLFLNYLLRVICFFYSKTCLARKKTSRLVEWSDFNNFCWFFLFKGGLFTMGIVLRFPKCLYLNDLLRVWIWWNFMIFSSISVMVFNMVFEIQNITPLVGSLTINNNQKKKKKESSESNPHAWDVISFSPNL